MKARKTMKQRIIFIENGDSLVPYIIYTCAECGNEVGESSPREHIHGKVYCGECAFKLGLISETEYIKNHCFFMSADRLHAAVHNGEVYLTTSKKFPWERSSCDRSCDEYKEWRAKVFERDGYKCQICGQIGGTLNAHHIKPYKDYPDLRHDVNNGVTLCKTCHKKVHKEKSHEWLHTCESEDC